MNLGLISGLITLISLVILINDPKSTFLKHSRVIYRLKRIGIEIR